MKNIEAIGRFKGITKIETGCFAFQYSKDGVFYFIGIAAENKAYKKKV